jgi:hypothetical protein
MVNQLSTMVGYVTTMSEEWQKMATNSGTVLSNSTKT